MLQIGARDLLGAWGKLLRGGTPLLSIEVTRECPLRCPGCYARQEGHADAAASRREPRGDDLVSGVLALVARHRPLHVSLVGGEPLRRRRELDVLLPELARRDVASMVVTSGVFRIPAEWDRVPRAVVSVSVDGLAPDHDRRRAPATYDRILRNIAGRRVGLHWTVVHGTAGVDGYFEKYLAFWSAIPEVQQIMVSAYTPQCREQSPEMLTVQERRTMAERLPALRRRFPKLLMTDEIAQAYLHPPPAPERCLFARMSRAYASDLATELSPCVIGPNPDCLQCGCAIAMALQGIAATRIKGPLRVGHLIAVTTGIAGMVNRVRGNGASARNRA